MLIDTPTLTPPRPVAPAAVPPPQPAVTKAATIFGLATPTSQIPTHPKFPWVLTLGGLALILWAFLPTLDILLEKWINDPQYSHGFLVPVFSGYLLWRFSHLKQSWVSEPWPLLGAAVFGLVLGARVISGGLFFVQLDALALLVSLAGLALAVGGVRFLKVTAPAIAFLVFMVHLPYELERNVGGPLKVIATHSATFLLQTLGYPAVSEGNIILIDEVKLGVEDACSGLKMLMTFSAFAVGAVLVLQRTLFEKFMVILGIVPIALLSNILRITVTGVIYSNTLNESVRKGAHDYAGYFMMPLGLTFLALQLWVLGRLVVQPKLDTTPRAI